MPAQADLDGIQRLLSELVRLPESVEHTLASEGATARFRALEGLVCSDERLSAARRLDVYANGYFFRILEALQEDYAALQAAIGEDRFHNLVTAYLLRFPSQASSMRDVGGRLPRFIDSEPEADWVREQFPWACSLARLERALVECFDAADAEVASREDYTQLDSERFLSLRFELQPSMHRLMLDWPVVAIRTAHDQDAPLELPEAPTGSEHALVWRQDERVFYRKLEQAEADALDGVAEGLSFADLCGRAAQHVGEDESPARVASWLTRWLSDGCLVRDPLLVAPDSTPRP